MGAISVPFIPKDDIFAEAERLVERYHPSMAAPIPIEVIVDRDFGMDIRPLEGLKRTIGSPAYTAWASRSIFVDDRMFKVERGWYHFSLAHELGHIVLHPQLFQASGHRTRVEYEDFLSRLSEADRVRMEKQAQLFGGAFIAPTKTITAVADHCVELARKEGVVLTLHFELDWPYILAGMAKRLQVNEQTVDFRFRELCLIDRYV